MIPSRAVAARWTAYLAVIYIVTRFPEVAGIAGTEHPDQSVNSAAKVALIPVRLPLAGDADQRVMASAEKAVKSLKASTPGDKRGTAIFEFQAADGQSIGSTRFERALSLARFLAGDEFRRVRTVAYVPVSLTGHAVLPVLACEEIVVHPNVEFGAAGRGQSAIDATMRAAYREMAERRRTIPVPIVLGMLDPAVSVVEAQLVGGGKRYVLGDDLAALHEEVEVWRESTLVPAGELLTLTARKMRLESFASHFAKDRKALSEALEVSPAAIRENKVQREAWEALRVDLRGRITSSRVAEVVRTVRKVQRKETANLIGLYIDSSGGPAGPALQLINLLSDLDSKSLHTVAYVPNEARSVAALVALAADETYARQDAVLGGPGETVIAKDQLDAMKQPVRELAKAQNRDWSLLLGLVDRDLAVYRFRQQGAGTVRYFSEQERASQSEPEQWRRQNQLELADGVTGLEAKEYGLVVDCLDRLDLVWQRFNVENRVTVAEKNSMLDAIERLAVQPWFARTLLFVAFFAMISEASAPGIGVPGFISGLCFLLFFWCQFLNHTAGWLEVLLFVGGVACLAMELLVLPGFGVFGFGGGLMVLLSIVLASQTFLWPRNAYQMSQVPQSFLTLGVACGGVISAIWLMRRLLAESWLFRRLTLAPPSENANLGQTESLVHWDYLADKRGVTTTQLTPSGKARFGDEMVNVISDGLLVPNNTPVRVVEVRGNRVLVEPLEEGN